MGCFNWTQPLADQATMLHNCSVWPVRQVIKRASFFRFCTASRHRLLHHLIKRRPQPETHLQQPCSLPIPSSAEAPCCWPWGATAQQCTIWSRPSCFPASSEMCHTMTVRTVRPPTTAWTCTSTTFCWKPSRTRRRVASSHMMMPKPRVTPPCTKAWSHCWRQNLRSFSTSICEACTQSWQRSQRSPRTWLRNTWTSLGSAVRIQHILRKHPSWVVAITWKAVYILVTIYVTCN